MNSSRRIDQIQPTTDSNHASGNPKPRAYTDWALGMFSWFGYELAQHERLRLIRKAGFNTTSFWLARRWEKEHGADYNRVVREIRRAGLRLEYAHGDYRGCNAIWKDEAGSRAAVWQDYAYYIDFCAGHHIPTLVLHLTRGPHPPPPGEEGLEFLQNLTAHAEKAGVRLAIENTRHIEHVNYALEHIRSPFIGFCYDSSHDFLYGEPVGSILERWGRRLFVTHFSDNDGQADRHWIPDLSESKWRNVASAFPVRTFTGTIHMEVLGYLQASTPPQAFVTQAFQAAEGLKSVLMPQREDSHAKNSAADASS